MMCELCEEKPATAQCVQCENQPMCDGCQKTHSRTRATKDHLFIALGQAAPSILPCISKCLEHGSEIDTYCKTCAVPICTRCIVAYHNGHNVNFLKDISANIKPEYDASKQKAQNRGVEISKGYKVVCKTMDELIESKEKALENLEKVIEEVHVEIDTRKTVLKAEIEEYYDLKQKELSIQRDDLEIVNEGIISSVAFTDRLLKEGNEVEKMLSKQSVIERLNSLSDNMKIELQPIHDGIISFDGNHKKRELSDILSQFGQIDAHISSTSPHHSYIENINNKQSQQTCSINQPFQFNIIAIKSNGEINNNEKGNDHFIIDIIGPSKNYKTEISKAEGGKYAVKLNLNEIGNHEIHIKLKNQPIKNSPFNLNAQNKNIRDPKTINVNAIKFTIGLSSQGRSNDGQFNQPCDFCINSPWEKK